MQGALGLSNTADQYEPEHVSPTSLPPGTEVVRVGTGHYTSFAITRAGELFSWGRNNEHQLGRPLVGGEFECSATPRQVLGLCGTEVATATGSGVVSFATTTDGRLLAFGTSKRGQLGLGPHMSVSLRPMPVAALPGFVVQVAAGWGHAAVLLADGSVYTMGWPAHGRLGHSHAEATADEGEGALNARCVWEPRRVDLLGGVTVRAVACGLDHTMCLVSP